MAALQQSYSCWTSLQAARLLDSHAEKHVTMALLSQDVWLQSGCRYVIAALAASSPVGMQLLLFTWQQLITCALLACLAIMTVCRSCKLYE
jgi:hypothetical protein